MWKIELIFEIAQKKLPRTPPQICNVDRPINYLFKTDFGFAVSQSAAAVEAFEKKRIFEKYFFSNMILFMKEFSKKFKTWEFHYLYVIFWGTNFFYKIFWL